MQRPKQSLEGGGPELFDALTNFFSQCVSFTCPKQLRSEAINQIISEISFSVFNPQGPPNLSRQTQYSDREACWTAKCEATPNLRLFFVSLVRLDARDEALVVEALLV